MKQTILLKYISLAGFLLLALNSCRQDKPEATITTFSMSDTMMAKCGFHQVATEEVKNEIRLFGRITADNNKVADVNSIVSGVVKSIHVGLGDYVKQGQVLAVIQSSEVAAFQKEKLDAINDIAIAEKNLQVARDLYEGKLNSEKEVTAAEKDLAKSRAELQRISNVYSIYKLKDGSTFNVTAPISGFVTFKNITINDLLRSDKNEPLFTIAEINEIWAVANVNESDISKIQAGFDVVVHTLAFPDAHYEGKIEKMYNVIDPASRSMKVRVRLPNSDFKLKPEMNCTVDVHYNEDKQLIVLPSNAVIFDKSKYWVMVFKDRNNIETRQVELYRQLGDKTYVQNGLSAGETVIAQNGLLIYDAIND